ncbi:multiple epidermal growth factor-like domains protein 10 [Ostrea edulis]|uniref:multiple epidermal growth factor-like domains protein 10 n=1 Tax=Ostrea edulis TaxID=37623 RepID=UPI0024AE8E4E|nr:multiple epidermal growth factor-like domains protein 10 [Ostrea edulis]
MDAQLECVSGFYGYNCTSECPYPRYGWHCEFWCTCPISECNHQYGCLPTTWSANRDAAISTVDYFLSSESTRTVKVNENGTQKENGYHEKNEIPSSKECICNGMMNLIFAYVWCTTFLLTRVTGAVSCSKGINVDGSPECCENYYNVGNVCRECPPGYYGNSCSSPCPTPLYGMGCNMAIVQNVITYMDVNKL